MKRVEVKSDLAILRLIRKEVLKSLRAEARRLRKNVAAEAPKVSGNLRRKLKVRTGWDGRGPWARVITTARRSSTSRRSGNRTTFRYGLTVQRSEHYLQKGLAKTPRHRL